MVLKQKTYIDYLAFFICLIFIIAGCIVSLNRFWQYEETHIDFGYFDTAIWKVAHFQAPIVDHFILGRINMLGDHAALSIFLLSPLYWLTDKSEMILIVQALVVGLSGLFLYDIGRTVLKNKELSLAILLCYFLFLGLQNAVITEFHELTVMTLPLMIALWAIVKNKIPLYFVALIITLGFKEITTPLGIGIGIALFLLKKEWRKYGIITIVLSVIWGIIAFELIIPYFSHGKYLYLTNFPSGLSNQIYALVDNPIKRHTLIYSFLSFGFLPFFAPQFWLAILQDYASRFIPLNFVTRWDLGLHYNAQSAVLLSVSSIFGLNYLLKFKSIKKYAMILSIILIINAFILFRFILHGPFMLALNPAFYRHSQEFSFLNDIIKKIPKNVSIMTHNNLAPRFTHQDVSLLTVDYKNTKPQYILIDRREGQNPNNFTGSGNMDLIFESVSNDSHYKVFYKTNKQFIFKRK